MPRASRSPSRLDYGIGEHAGRPAVVHRDSGEPVAWVVTDERARYRARGQGWVSPPFTSLAHLIAFVADRASLGTGD
jgi:hypothetical protein